MELIDHRPVKKQRRDVDVKNFQAPNTSVVETVQTIAEQVPEETHILPIVGNKSHPDPQFMYLADYRSSTHEEDATAMTVYEAELNNNSE